MGKKEEKIWVVCGDEKNRNELVGNISQQFAGVFTVEGFAKTSDLDSITAKDVILIVLSLVGEKADPPWDIPWLGHRFRAPVIVEVDKDTPPQRAYRMIEWGAYDVFGTDDDVCDVIRRVLLLDEVLPPVKS